MIPDQLKLKITLDTLFLRNPIEVSDWEIESYGGTPHFSIKTVRFGLHAE